MLKEILIAMALIALDSCGGAKPAPSTHAQGEMCPMKLAGTRVVAIDTTDGVAVELSTTGDVSELRARAHHMAMMHEHMTGKMEMVPSTARVEDTDRGARIVLVPTDATQLAALRAHVHEHAEMMASGHCPMMEKGT